MEKKLYYPKLTRYEMARIIGARALQLAHGAPPLIDVSALKVKDPVAIAIVELLNGLLPISIKRRTADGSYELVPAGKLLTEDNRRYLKSILESWNIS